MFLFQEVNEIKCIISLVVMILLVMLKKLFRVILSKDNVQFIKFGLVGATSTIVSLLIYSFCVYLQVQYFIANFLAFVLSVLNSFFWNNKFVFKKNDGTYRNLFYTLLKSYASYSITGIFFQSLLLFLFIDKLGISKYIAQILCILINLPVNFLLNKYWSYKSVSTKRR